MFIGVCVFSFASGSLSSLMANYDNKNSELANRLGMLARISKRFKLSHELEKKLKNEIVYVKSDA